MEELESSELVYLVDHRRNAAMAVVPSSALVGSLVSHTRDKGPADYVQSTGLFCRYCKKDNHVKEDCWKLKKKNGVLGSSSNSGNNPVRVRGFAGLMLIHHR
ncbi:unnamed protein product [Linum trigynum]|uniref:CCHC-type domain-containing protein n=1 Tax=Linum trigynum TaxID=586398 RepID=A0AAV2F6R2_9ROSI